jgi:hypothetical protein
VFTPDRIIGYAVFIVMAILSYVLDERLCHKDQPRHARKQQDSPSTVHPTPKISGLFIAVFIFLVQVGLNMLGIQSFWLGVICFAAIIWLLSHSAWTWLHSKGYGIIEGCVSTLVIIVVIVCLIYKPARYQYRREHPAAAKTDVATAKPPGSIVPEPSQPKIMPHSERVRPAVSAPPLAPKIEKDKTSKYQALALSSEIITWLGDEAVRIPEFEPRLQELFRQYREKFQKRVHEISGNLRRCGADTHKLEDYINKAESSYDNQGHLVVGGWAYNYLTGIALELRNAAYDIPQGHPECGTNAKDGSGFVEEGNYMIKFGGRAAGFEEDQLDKPNSSIKIGGMSLFQIYLLDGKFCIDTSLYSGPGMPQVRIRGNEFVINNPSWDRNFTDKAFEVVDQNEMPMLQVISETTRRIEINGVFPTTDGKGVIVITPSGIGSFKFDSNGQLPTAIPLAPLFKYPSWKYQGMYAR